MKDITDKEKDLQKDITLKQKKIKIEKREER